MTNEILSNYSLASQHNKVSLAQATYLSEVMGILMTFIGEYVDRSRGLIGLLIHDHTRNGLGFISMTTSQHVSL